MKTTLRRRLRAYFLEPHTRRDADLEFWWQLPEDTTRTKSAWTQPWVDLASPATFSEWHAKVAERRVQAYDQLRPAFIRAASLTVIVAALAVLKAPVWCWSVLSVAAIQVPLEIYLQRFHALDAPDPRWKTVRRMRDMARSHFRTRTYNATGVLGAIACPLNVAAVSFADPGGEQGWLKIVALSAAILYLNSGLGNVVLDPPNYSESSEMPPIMHNVRPYAPVLSLSVVSTIVWFSVIHERWTAPMVPVAYLCCGLTLLIGSTMRNHDRVVAAAAYVGRRAVLDAREALGSTFHDDLGPAKAAADRVSVLPGVEYRDAIELKALSSFLTNFNTRVGLFAAQRMDLRSLAKKVASPGGISPRNIEIDIRWDSMKIRKEDHRVAVRMTTALVQNVAQAVQKREFRGYPKQIILEGYVFGSERDRGYHLSVRDHLPPVSEDEWCCEGGTLRALRDWLRDDYHGDLTQEVMGDGTKRITAAWSDRPPNIWVDPDIDSEDR